MLKKNDTGHSGSDTSSGDTDGSDSPGSLIDFLDDREDHMTKRDRAKVSQFMKKVSGVKRRY